MDKIVVVEYDSKRYSVVGQSETHYICTEPWDEEIGDSIRIPKGECKLV